MTAPGAEGPLSATYAESVALAGLQLDGEQEFSVRLARFPGRNRGGLWLSALVGGRRFAGAASGVELGALRGRTPVEADAVVFEVSGDPTAARFESRDRHSGAMLGIVRATGRVQRADHPDEGAGDERVSIEAEFRAAHEGVRVRPGRLEVMGRVTAILTTPDRVYRLEVPGKWHEQTGERPRFAPAFTYFNLLGESAALLASRTANRPWGYALLDGRVVRVTDFTIDPYGTPRRAFRVALEDDRVVEGEARVKRETSVPIEGRRRPGALVVARTRLGDMVGHLNDWDPGD